jgi:probable rRNA maturation factor
MIYIDINPSLSLTFDTALLERAALATLEHQSADPQSELTIVLTDDGQLQQLNRDYRDVDAPTDVLSFPASETDPETGAAYLGDILISVPRAAQQATTAGHSVEAEIQLLTIHGVLHLLGHDHAEGEEKAQMWAAQAEVLEKIGLPGLKVLE